MLPEENNQPLHLYWKEKVIVKRESINKAKHHIKAQKLRHEYTNYDQLIKSKYLLLLTPIFIIILSFLGTGIGIIVSSLTTKYKDLQVLFTFIITLLMYATPIIYPLSAVPIDYRSYLLLNPVAPLVEAFRFIYLGAGMFNYLYLLYSFLFSITIFFFGVIIFNKIEKNFIDTI